METINSMASAAAKAVWGESSNNNNNETHEPGTTTTATTATTTDNNSTTTNNNDNMSAINETRGQEPISGKLGDTSKGEPFDAGNIEPAGVAQTKTPTTEAPLSGTSTTEAPTTGAATGVNTTGTSTTGVSPTTNTTHTPTTHTTSDSAVGTGATTQPKGPTAEKPSTTGDTGFKAAQADIRDPETNPTTDPKKEAERKNVDDTGALDSSENPSKVDGAGPRPVEEVARDHGGDAGAGAAGTAGKKEGGEPLGSAGGEGDSSESKGTGEEYVKSTGLQADGGDFDATKPGAGREADRLLEEKGLANPAAAAAASGNKAEADVDEGTESPDTKEKKSLKDKIKAKLHKN